MIISQFIEVLQKFMDEFGDIQVLCPEPIETHQNDDGGLSRFGSLNRASVNQMVDEDESEIDVLRLWSENPSNTSEGSNG